MVFGAEAPAAPAARASRSWMTRRLCSSASRSTSTQAGRRAASRSSTPDASSKWRAGSITAITVLCAALEGRRLADEDHLHRPGLAVPVLGDDQLGEPPVLFRGVV